MNTFIVEIKNERLTEWYRVEISKDNTIRYKKLNEDVYGGDFSELLRYFKKVILEYESPLIDAIKNLLCTKSKRKCLVNVYQMEEREKKRTLYKFESGIIEKDSNPTKKRSDGKKKKKKPSVKKRSRRDGVLSRVTSPRRSPVRRRQPDVVDLTDDSEERRQKRRSIKAERIKLREKRRSIKEQKTILIEKKLDNSECGICFDEFDLEAENCVVLKKCGHSYHIDCINRWLGDRNEKTCPNCRMVFERNGWFHCHEIDTEALQKKIKKAVDNAKKKKNYIEIREIREIIDVDPDVIEIE